MDSIQQLKENIAYIIEQRDIIPSGVMQLVEKAFTELEKFYAKLGYDYAPTKAYIEGNLMELKSDLNGGIGVERREKLLDQVYFVLHQIEHDAEQLEEERKNEDKYTDGIKNIKCDNSEIVYKISDKIINSLRDVNSRQGSILYARGCNDKRIHQIDEYFEDFLSKLNMNDCQEKINIFLQEDESELRHSLLTSLEEYLQQNKTDASKMFRDAMNVGISLQEQHNFSENYVQQSEENDKELEEKSAETEGLLSLPDDVIK